MKNRGAAARRIAVLSGAVLLVVAPALTSPAFARDETPGENLGGYIGQASAMALSFQPFLPALVSTGDVPFEGTLALTTASVKSGGGAFGRSAIVWPGSALADFGPIVSVGFGQPEIGALVPKWPLQAQATQDDGDVTTGAPPGLAMRAKGYPDESGADFRVADLFIEGLVRIEHIASTSSSIVTDAAVNSAARVTLHGVSLLDGHITIEEIRSISTTASNGTTASSAGDVDVVGLKIGGIDVSVTDDGFQVKGLPPDAGGMPGAGGEAFPGTSPEEQVQRVLDNFGARLTLFRSAGNVSGSAADRIEVGLVLSLDNPAAGVGPIPPGRFDFILASTKASALGSPPFVAELPELPSTDVLGSESPGSFSIGSGPEVSRGTVADLRRGLADVASGAPAAGDGSALDVGLPQRAEYAFGGVPIGLGLGLLIAAAVAARYLRNFFNLIITPRGGPTSGGESE